VPGYLEQLSSWLVEVGKHLEDHARVRAAVAELATTRSLSVSRWHIDLHVASGFATLVVGATVLPGIPSRGT
jgi:hypothetical protein